MTDSRWAQTFFTKIKTGRARAAGPAHALHLRPARQTGTRTANSPAAATSRTPESPSTRDGSDGNDDGNDDGNGAGYQRAVTAKRSEADQLL